MPLTYPDDFAQGRRGPLDAPASRAVPVVPDDVLLVVDGAGTSTFPRSLFVGTAGNVVVDMAEVGTAGTGTDVVFKNVASGQVLPIRVKRVKAATTAADIVALY